MIEAVRATLLVDNHVNLIEPSVNGKAGVVSHKRVIDVGAASADSDFAVRFDLTTTAVCKRLLSWTIFLCFQSMCVCVCVCFYVDERRCSRGRQEADRRRRRRHCVASAEQGRRYAAAGRVRAADGRAARAHCDARRACLGRSRRRRSVNQWQRRRA